MSGAGWGTSGTTGISGIGTSGTTGISGIGRSVCRTGTSCGGIVTSAFFVTFAEISLAETSLALVGKELVEIFDALMLFVISRRTEP